MDTEAKTQQEFNAMPPEQLAELWLEAKQAETACANYRVMLDLALEHQLLTKPEGSQSFNFGDLKVEVKGVIYRKVDEKKWREIQSKIPADLSPVEWVETAKVSDKGCRYLAENEPALWALCASAITVKPGKTGVKVERKGE